MSGHVRKARYGEPRARGPASTALRAVTAAAMLLLSFGIVPAARADYEETERRLKIIGIEEAMRAEVRGAIDRGVQWLLARQREDGGWARGLPPDLQGTAGRPSELETGADVGTTVLVALALRHAGTETAKASVRRARAWLFDDLPRRKEVLSRTYEAGLAAMLVMADGDKASLAEDLAQRLVRGETTYGWWGYTTDAVSPRPHVNLSTTQFGALGLWAAARAGATVPTKAWERLARGHIHRQGSSGSWAYGPRERPDVLRAHFYPQGTFMGLANLILGTAGLGDAAKPSLTRRIERARANGVAALVRDGQTFLESFTGLHTSSGRLLVNRWPYYSLYALEKACLFADIERLGDVPWCRTGARALLALQERDGSWGRGRHWTEPPEHGTAFALLFLLRASATCRPTTPRSVDGPPPAPVTPSEPDR